MKKNKPAVVFFGTPKEAEPVLRALCDHYQVVAVVTQPPKPQGRHQQILPSPISVLAHQLKLPVIETDSKHALYSLIKDIKADVGVVFSFGLILTPNVLAHFPFGILNLHPSLLPKYRGASPVTAALLNNDVTTGVTLIRLDEKLDHGPIVAQKTYVLPSNILAPELLKQLIALGTQLLIKKLPAYIGKKITLQEQVHDQATFTRELIKSDGQINWALSANQVYNQFRALQPWPGVFTTFHGKPLKLNALEVMGEQLGTPGQVVLGQGEILVICGSGAVRIRNLTLAGKSPMSGADFLRGNKNFIGCILPN